MICPFTVGQRVVCVMDKWYPFGWVNDKFVRLDVIEPVPKRGEICKIIGMDRQDYINSIGLVLEKYPNQDFCFRGFRPLNERPKETSIEVFKKLLNPTNHKQLEKA